MITLTKKQIIRLRKKLLDATGGMDGIRDESLLDSSLSAAFQTFDGARRYIRPRRLKSRELHMVLSVIIRLRTGINGSAFT